MARHSQFNNIKHRKAAQDAVKGKAFTKHAKLIQMAVKDGGGLGDPDKNAALRAAIDNARKDNTPFANIERAIKKGTGEDKDSQIFSENVYEGIGPGGTAFMITTLSDNTNRTFGNLRTVLTKNEGNIGTSGSQGWMFDRKGVVTLTPSVSHDRDTIELMIIESGADDMKRNEDEEGITYDVYTGISDLMNVRSSLEKAGFGIENSSIKFVPKSLLTIDDLETAKLLVALYDAIDADDDVTQIDTNFVFSDSIAGQL